MKPRAFTNLNDIERALGEFDKSDGLPRYTADAERAWGLVTSSNRLEYARSLNDFRAIIIPGKFPPNSQLAVFCALQVFGKSAFEYWSVLREHYCRGKPRGSHAGTDEALDVWYAIDAWLQSWLYSPQSCRRPQNNSPSEWIYCLGSTDPTPHLRMSHAFLCRLGAPLPANYTTARRNLHDVKGIFQRYVIVPKNSVIPNIESLMLRYPLIGWDIWQKAVYLLTNDVKPPSHFPTFGWRHHRVIDYVRKGLLFHGPEIEREGLGKPWSLHGLLWPKQLETLKTLMSEGGVKTETGPPVTSGRMLRRTFAHE